MLRAMWSRLAAAVPLITLLWSAVACDNATVASAYDSLLPTADATECLPSACTPSGEAPEPEFKIGTNEAGLIEVAAFTEAIDQAEVPVIFGGQGAWMVVLAVATNQLDCCVERVNIRAQLATVDGSNVLGMINYRRRPLLKGDDGKRYLMNTWMVLGDEAKWKDQSAVLTLSFEPYGGGPILEKTVTVTLRKDSTVVTPAAPALRLGTHAKGAKSSDAFLELADGDDLEVVVDEGGSLGLVLATSASSLAAEVDKVVLQATLTSPDGSEEFGSSSWNDQPLAAGSDGLDYVLDLWMGFNESAMWQDREAILAVQLESVGAEATLKKSVTVTLRRQASQ